MKILVTGSNGFVGSHIKKAVSVIALDMDLLDKKKLREFFADCKPDFVIHLAAKTYVPDSFANPQDVYAVNFLGTLNLLEALKEGDFRGRMLYVGSSDGYGIVDPKDLPVLEEHALHPRSPYAVSKIAAEALCYQWSQTENFEIVLTRPFNHIGPGQNERFAVSNFAKQVALGLDFIEVGDLSVTRDFTDVRDVVRAYLLLLEKGRNGEVYNVCSQKERTLESILHQLLSIKGLQTEIRVSKNRLRPTEQRRICGSFEKLNRDTGWQPLLPFEMTLQELLLDWEHKNLCESMH